MYVSLDSNFFETADNECMENKNGGSIGVALTLQKETIVDASNISLFGFTLGGTVGLYAATLDNRISCVVSIGGFTPMRTDVAEKGTSGATRYSHL